MHNKKSVNYPIRIGTMPVKRRMDLRRKHEKSREEKAIDEILYGDKIFSQRALKVFKSRIR